MENSSSILHTNRSVIWVDTFSPHINIVAYFNTQAIYILQSILLDSDHQISKSIKFSIAQFRFPVYRVWTNKLKIENRKTIQYTHTHVEKFSVF